MARRVAHFEVQELLGKGASGSVHRALDTTLRRSVALKLMKPSADDPKFEERVRQEAEVHARLRSPHVVQLHSVGRTSRRVYMAMELVNGQSLDAILERGDTLEPEEARTLMIQAARGLRDAQRAGVVHRDIKPSNLLLDCTGALKIADFGVAKALDASPAITQDGCVVGTPLYIAPEQALGRPVDFRADMYSLGCTFFHLLAGAPPFAGANVVEVMTAHVGGARPRVSEAAPRVPGRLADAIDRAMARRPAHRFQSYDELIEELEACSPVTLVAAGVWPRAAAVVLNVIAGLVITVPLGVWGLLLHLAYVTVAHAYRGQTIGKYAMRLRVIRADGRPLGLGLAAARTVLVLWYPILAAVLLLCSGPGALAHALAQFHTTDLSKVGELAFTAAVSQLALALVYVSGFVFAAVHPQGLAVHDLLLKTRVVYVMINSVASRSDR